MQAGELSVHSIENLLKQSLSNIMVPYIGSLGDNSLFQQPLPVLPPFLLSFRLWLPLIFLTQKFRLGLLPLGEISEHYNAGAPVPAHALPSASKPMFVLLGED